MVANNILNCKKLTPDARLPTRNNTYDAGADLYAKEDVLLPSIPLIIMNWAWNYIKKSVYSDASYIPLPAESLVTKIETGISIEIPDGEVGLIMDRSSMGSKSIIVVGGVMDSVYRGDYTVCLLNLSFKSYQIKAGDKIAQLVIVPCRNYQFKESQQLSATDRGSNNFGSSGR